jgi:predicted nucleic acid-binding protein
MPKTLYLDTNILIYLLERHENLSEKVAKKLEAHTNDGGVLITSAMTVTEFLAGTVSSTLDTLHRVPRLKFVDLDELLAEKAGLMKRHSGLQIGDAIHLATAVHAEAETFFTNDTHLAATASKHIAVQAP